MQKVQGLGVTEVRRKTQQGNAYINKKHREAVLGRNKKWDSDYRWNSGSGVDDFWVWVQEWSPRNLRSSVEVTIVGPWLRTSQSLWANVTWVLWCIVSPQLWMDISCSWTGPLTLRQWHHSTYAAWPFMTIGILVFINHCFTSVHPDCFHLSWAPTEKT